MLCREELREISKIQGNGSYYVSLYLNVNPITNPKGDYLIQFKNMMKNASETVEKQVFKKIKEDMERLDNFVFGNKRDFKKGLAILASGDVGLWQEYHLHIPVKSELIVDKTPYVKPLLDIVDNYSRYAVLLVDKEAARIFVIQFGEMVEYGEVHTKDVPGKHKKGGWFSLSQNSYERHTDYHVGLHLKDVIKELESFLKGEHVERIILGGSDDAVSMIKGLLPKSVSDRIIGEFHAGMSENNVDVLKKTEPVLKAHEKKISKQAVDELIIRARKNEKAVMGMPDVLNAVQEGKAMRMMFLSDFTYPGFVCTSCKAVSAQKVEACPYCKAPMEDVNYLVDLIAQKAVEQGAHVDVIGENEDLKKAGSIGAILRF